MIWKRSMSFVFGSKARSTSSNGRVFRFLAVSSEAVISGMKAGERPSFGSSSYSPSTSLTRVRSAVAPSPWLKPSTAELRVFLVQPVDVFNQGDGATAERLGAEK